MGNGGGGFRVPAEERIPALLPERTCLRRRAFPEGSPWAACLKARARGWEASLDQVASVNPRQGPGHSSRPQLCPASFQTGHPGWGEGPTCPSPTPDPL